MASDSRDAPTRRRGAVVAISVSGLSGDLEDAVGEYTITEPGRFVCATGWVVQHSDGRWRLRRGSGAPVAASRNLLGRWSQEDEDDQCPTVAVVDTRPAPDTPAPSPAPVAVPAPAPAPMPAPVQPPSRPPPPPDGPPPPGRLSPMRQPMPQQLMTHGDSPSEALLRERAMRAEERRMADAELAKLQAQFEIARGENTALRASQVRLTAEIQDAARGQRQSVAAADLLVSLPPRLLEAEELQARHLVLAMERSEWAEHAGILARTAVAALGQSAEASRQAAAAVVAERRAHDDTCAALAAAQEGAAAVGRALDEERAAHRKTASGADRLLREVESWRGRVSDDAASGEALRNANRAADEAKEAAQAASRAASLFEAELRDSRERERRAVEAAERAERERAQTVEDVREHLRAAHAALAAEAAGREQLVRDLNEARRRAAGTSDRPTTTPPRITSHGTAAVSPARPPQPEPQYIVPPPASDRVDAARAGHEAAAEWGRAVVRELQHKLDQLEKRQQDERREVGLAQSKHAAEEQLRRAAEARSEQLNARLHADASQPRTVSPARPERRGSGGSVSTAPPPSTLIRADRRPVDVYRAIRRAAPPSPHPGDSQWVNTA
eukprot:TRINITY_DN37053_c0_g1_i1.p1 TRINITY_DN37053_c0_g1~~TRINITY_DN37053_c0_g1_i1.p1  ORF type:complete len:615 (+),score=217.50 TRINITY_DN37053_c0_g1_i1:74-1918(+)